MTLRTLPMLATPDTRDGAGAWTDALRAELAESLLEAWRSIGKVSGSALLAGEKKSQTQDQRSIVYHEACFALGAIGCAYHDLTGKHPTCEPEAIGDKP